MRWWGAYAALIALWFLLACLLLGVWNVDDDQADEPHGGAAGVLEQLRLGNRGAYL